MPIARPFLLGAMLLTILSGRAVAAPTNGDAWESALKNATAGLFAPEIPISRDVSTPTLQIPQGPQSAPVPAGTGFHSLLKDTAQDFLAFPKRRSTWVLLGIGAAAAAISHPADDDLNSHVGGTRVGHLFAPGKYIGAFYTHVGVALGLYTIGRFVVPAAVEGEPKTNKWSHMGFDLLRAQMLSQALVLGIKYSVQRDRPTGECCAFPSGHAAAAFAAAAVIERHFGYRFSWPAILAATYVGASRLHDNRHFLSDVVFGAALGTATGWTVVGRHGRESYAFVPTAVPGGAALLFTRAR